MRNHAAAANHEGHIDRFLLLGATYAQPVGLDDIVILENLEMYEQTAIILLS
jgi:hypothetical protein